MPGIVTVARSQAPSAELADRIARQVYDGATSLITAHDEAGIAIRVVANPEGEPASVFAGRNWVVALAGYPRYLGMDLNSRESVDFLENALESVSLRVVDDISGQFQLLLWHRSTQTAYLLNDKTSTHPWYCLALSDKLVAAPESLCLRVCRDGGWRGATAPLSIPQYLGSGHLWGHQTFLEDCRRVGPGELAMSREGDWELQSYWQPSYEPSLLPRAERMEQLTRAIASDLEQLPPGKGVITLSGGMDSRALLGMSLRGGLDVEAVTYTFGTDVLAGSDADVARTVAKKAGVPWHRVVTTDEAYLDNLTHVLRATGGESDTACYQESFLGSGFYRSLRSKYDFLLRGDEKWGWGDSAFSVQDAFLICQLLNVDEQPRARTILSPDAYRTFVEELTNARADLVLTTRVDPMRPNDIKDTLYWQHREARMLQNMAYFRRQWIPHLAPFLGEHTLSVIETLLPEDRVRKKLFVDSMTKLFPELFAIQGDVNAKWTGFEIEQAFARRPELRELVRDVLQVNPPAGLAEVFDPQALDIWISSLFEPTSTASASGRRRYLMLRQVNSNLRRFPALRALAIGAARRSGRLTFPLIDSNYLFRLTVLGLALREHQATVVD